MNNWQRIGYRSPLWNDILGLTSINISQSHSSLGNPTTKGQGVKDGIRPL